MALLQTGVYVILTGVDVNGKQCHEFGSSEGNLKEQLVLNRAGTPGDNDYIISFLENVPSFFQKRADV